MVQVSYIEDETLGSQGQSIQQDFFDSFTRSISFILASRHLYILIQMYIVEVILINERILSTKKSFAWC